MSRKSGNRFSEKDMRLLMNLEHILIPLDRDVLCAGRNALSRPDPVEDDGLDVANGLFEKRILDQSPSHDSFDLIGKVSIVLRNRPDREDEMIGIDGRQPSGVAP